MSEESDKVENWRQETTAIVFLDAWGSTCSLDEKWNGHGYCLRDYCPEWLSEEKWEINGYEVDHDCCITVLRCGWGSSYEPADPEEIDGYRLMYTYPCGERECPECEGWKEWQIDHPEDKETPCPLCKGDKYLYWGEEWRVCVYAPIPRPQHWISGGGTAGCLYDHGPNISDSKEMAIEELLFTYASDFSNRYREIMKRDLENDGIHYFDRRIKPFAGADYCEIDECNCQGSDHPEDND